MFKDGKSRVDVAIELDIESYEAISVFHDYLQLINLDRLVTTYQYLGINLSKFLELFDMMKEEGIVTQPASQPWQGLFSQRKNLQDWRKNQDISTCDIMLNVCI